MESKAISIEFTFEAKASTRLPSSHHKTREGNTATLSVIKESLLNNQWI